MSADTVSVEAWDVGARVGMLPLMAAVVDGGSKSMPAAARDQLTQTAKYHLRTMADLRSLASTLNGAALRWLVIKGPVLAEAVYQTPGLRVYADLDIVVHPQDLERALDALTRAGARLLDRNWQHIRRTEQGEISLELAYGTVLDLHWHVISSPRIRADIGIDIDTLFDAAIWVEVGGLHVRTLDPVDTLCYVSLHAVLAGGHQMRWLIDVQQCVAWARGDLERLPSRARELGCELALAVMLRRVATHLDPSVRSVLRGLQVPRTWYLLCAVVDRLAPLDPGIDQYSGRAVLSSTRANTRQSARAVLRALGQARAAGKARRTNTVDVSILRSVGGDDADRAAWLALARRHAS